jgi:hypothetical protein
MPISQKLIDNDVIHLVGFVGGKGRSHLINELASELAHNGKRVVLTNIERDILPPSGQIIFQKDQNKLLKQIEREIKENPVIYAGREMEDHFVVGVDSTMIGKLAESRDIDYLFLIMGNSKSISFLSANEITEIIKCELMQELIYCFQFDMIDQVLGEQDLGEVAQILSRFTEFKPDKAISYELMLKYFTDSAGGAYKLFQQKWPIHLIFTDINNLLLENRCINFARDLQSHQIKHIWQANLKENMIKRISSR